MKKVLFIEDDPIVGHIYACQLEWAGYQVELADDGETGMRALKRFQPNAGADRCLVRRTRARKRY